MSENLFEFVILLKETDIEFIISWLFVKNVILFPIRISGIIKNTAKKKMRLVEPNKL